MKKRLILLTMILMIISMIPTQAQDGETFKVWSPIESVTPMWTEIESEDDEAARLVLALTIEGIHTDACEFDLVTETNVYENNIDIQAYRDIPIAATCLREDTPFETEVVLDMPPGDLPEYIVVNDQVWQLTMPEGDDISTDDLPELEELMLVGAVIDDVNAVFVESEEEDEDAYYALELSGSHGVGCEVPLVYSVRELAESTLIGVFNPVPESIACPAVLRVLDASIEIPATSIPLDALVTVNEFIIDEMETQAMSDTNKVMTNINSVTINVMESDPSTISLSVSGEHPDGCDYPVMVDQDRDSERNIITVSIYREVPTDVMCPMMLNPYEADIDLNGDFDSGSYEIRVNGVVENVDID